MISSSTNRTIFLPFFHLGVGGVETKLISLANELSERGVHVVMPLFERVEAERSEFLHKDVRVFYYQDTYLSWLLPYKGYSWWLWILIIKFLPAKVVLSLEDQSVMVLYGTLKRALIWFLRDKVDFIINVDTLLSKERMKTLRVIASAWAYARTIIAVSRQSQQDLKSLFPSFSEKIVYIPNWNTLEKNVKAKPFNERRYSYLFFGRIEPQKRPLFCIRLAKWLRKHKPNKKVTVIGSGSLLSKLKEETNKHNLTTFMEFLPPVKDALSVLRDTQYLFLPSMYEGCPLTVLEARKLEIRLLLSPEVKITLPPLEEENNAKEQWMNILLS